MPSPRRSPQLALHPPIQPTSEWDAAGDTRTRPLHHPRRQMPSLRPSLLALSKPSCSLLPFLTLPRAHQRESYSPSTPQPFHQRQSEACPGSEVYSSKRRAAAAACSPACLLPPAPGIQPSPHHRRPGQSPPAWGWDRPRVASITRCLRSLRPPPCLPPVHTHEQRSQPVVPGLGRSLLLPQPRHGSRGSAKGMLCPARKHGRTQAAERNRETARSTAPKSVRQTHASYCICLNQIKYGFTNHSAFKATRRLCQIKSKETYRVALAVYVN